MKIWFFLIALLAAVGADGRARDAAPRAASLIKEEQDRLAIACGVIDILLTDDARNRVDLAGTFARAPEIVNALESCVAAPTSSTTRA